jgi:hypothetical protein
LNPLQITDDNHRFIDLSSLEDRVTEELGSELTQGQKLVLQDWKFVLRRIPNSHEYYFDLNVNKYELKSDDTYTKPELEPIKMEDDEQVRYFFEQRKRSEIEKMVRGGPSRGGADSVKRSPSKKDSALSDHTQTAVPSSKITEIKSLIPPATSEELQKTLRKGSGAKQDYKNPSNLDTSFFKKAGVLSATSKFLAEDSFVLTIEEIMSVPSFIPQVKRSVVRLMPVIRAQRLNSSDSHPNETTRESQARMVFRVSQDARGKGEVTFEDIHEQIKSGAVKWNQITFTKSTFEYLRKHSMLLEQTD